MKKLIFIITVLLIGSCFGCSQSSTKNEQKNESHNGHEMVDLGLSVKWATCNVGASTPSDYGDYFAWGETAPKSDYQWSTCFDCMDETGESWETYKIGGETQITPTSGHDAAQANWGGSWRMPTDAELKELNDNCTWEWINMDGHEGYEVTGPNGNSIFLPAAGYCSGSTANSVGTGGYYWSSSFSASSDDTARSLFFDDGYHAMDSNGRYIGRSVRPVVE